MSINEMDSKIKEPRIASEAQKAALARARETANKHR